MAISPSKETEIIDYPISFPIKIIGPSIPDFEALILDILRKYAP
jgi:putative lipoic acid-binding regulatory protein